MRANTYTYSVAITKTDGKVTIIKTQAESTWEAEDRLHSRFIREQPDRTAYSAKRCYASVRQQVGGVL